MSPGDGRGDGTGDRSATERTARELLGRVGVGESAAPEIIRAANALRTRSASQAAPTEYAAMFELQTGAIVGSVAAGSGREVDVTEQLRALRQGGSYLAFHTHAGGTPFSLLDVKTFLENPVITAIAVLTRDGRWFAMARDAAAPIRDHADALARIAEAFVRLRPHYRAMAASGALTPEAALAALLHHIWCEVAGQIGLRYDWTDT